MNLLQSIKDHPGLLERLDRLRVDPLAETPVLFAKIKLLWQCNLSCVFCRRPSATPPMSRERVLTLLDALRDRGLRKIHYSGGEIFLHPDILPILEASCSRGLQVNFTSNGTLIGKDLARAIVETGVHSLSLSLDSHDPRRHDALRGQKGAFKKTVRALEYLLRYRKKGPVLRINTVVSRENFSDLDQMHDFLTGLDREIIWKLIPVDSPSKKLLLRAEQAEELLTLRERWSSEEDSPETPVPSLTPRSLTRGLYAGGYYGSHPCYMPWLHLFVDPAGFAYPCCMTRGKIPALGRLEQDSLSDILEGDRMQKLRMSLAGGIPLDICRHCDDFIEENALIESEIHSMKGGNSHEQKAI